MILGLGTDIVEIERIAASRAKTELWERYVLTEEELRHISGYGSEQRKIEFLAGRWAAKEAFAKALGTGIGEHCSFRQITVLPDPLGCPVVTVSGAAKILLDKKGVRKIHVSISHERSYAVATVIFEG